LEPGNGGEYCTLRWPTDKEREEMKEVCSIGEVPQAMEVESYLYCAA